MLTFGNLNVYDVADPDESLIEALRAYPELREFENVLIEDEEVVTLLKEGPREIPEGFVSERLEAQGLNKVEKIHRLNKVENLEILEAGEAERRAKLWRLLEAKKLAEQDNPALREALSDYGSKPKASKLVKTSIAKPKASPRKESPKGTWGTVSFL